MYRLFVGCNPEPVVVSEDKEEIWKKIGEMSIFSTYEVLDENGNAVPEFIPF